MDIEKLHAKYGEEKVLCIPNLYEEGYGYLDLMHDITRFGEEENNFIRCDGN